MAVLKYVLMGIYAVVCFTIIVLVMKQNKEENGASSAIMGASANNFYEKNKGMTSEAKLKNATIVLMIVFAVLTLALGILYTI